MLALDKSTRMDENLQLLIKHYEVEQQLLQSLLDECLAEEDYKYARYYLKNLRLLQETLFNLYALSDYNHTEKTKVLRMISNIESIKKTDNDFISYREKQLQELNAKLSILNEMPIIEIEEKYDIENAIIQLLEKQINGFKLFILKEANLYLDFTLTEIDIVHIEFTPFKALFNEYLFSDLLGDSEIESLHKNGFKLNDDQNVFYINFNLQNQSTQLLEIFLSRIFFEILHWHSRKNFELVIY